MGAAIQQVKCARDLATSGYLLAEDAAALLARERKRVPQIKQTLDQVQGAASNSELEELDFSNGQLSDTPADALLSDVSPDFIPTLQSAFGAVVQALPPDSALDLIETILRRLSDKQL